MLIRTTGMRWTSPICATVDIDEEDAQTDHQLHQGAQQAPEPGHQAESVIIKNYSNQQYQQSSSASYYQQFHPVPGLGYLGGVGGGRQHEHPPTEPRDEPAQKVRSSRNILNNDKLSYFW